MSSLVTQSVKFGKRKKQQYQDQQQQQLQQQEKEKELQDGQPSPSKRLKTQVSTTVKLNPTDSHLKSEADDTTISSLSTNDNFSLSLPLTTPHSSNTPSSTLSSASSSSASSSSVSASAYSPNKGVDDDSKIKQQDSIKNEDDIPTQDPDDMTDVKSSTNANNVATTADTSSSTTTATSSSTTTATSSSTTTSSTTQQHIILPLTSTEIHKFQEIATMHQLRGYKIVDKDYKSLETQFQYAMGGIYDNPFQPVVNQCGFHFHFTALSALLWVHEHKGIPTDFRVLKTMVRPQKSVSVGVDKVSTDGIKIVGELTDLKERNLALSGCIQSAETNRIYYWRHGQLHRDSNQGPALHDPASKAEQYWEFGQLHREGDLPCLVSTKGDYFEYRIRGQLHRDQGKPARISPEFEEYWQNGLLIRKVDLTNNNNNNTNVGSATVTANAASGAVGNYLAANSFPKVPSSAATLTALNQRASSNSSHSHAHPHSSMALNSDNELSDLEEEQPEEQGEPENSDKENQKP
jgi:hypothetical protein